MSELLVSVHAVTPGRLSVVEEICGMVRASGLAPPTLLIVPGLDWQPPELARLRELASGGHALAGHGWRHHVSEYGNLRHRLHGWFISRLAAEHLALDTDGISELIRRCHAWFGQNGLPAPGLYVPPAWAMGSIDRGELVMLGFRYFEYRQGIYDCHTDSFRRMPLLRFEADTALRAVFLGSSNAINRAFARQSRSLRIAIHPDDFDQRLASRLRRTLGIEARARSQAPR